MRLGSLAAGALPALAFPEPSWWWLGFVGLVPTLALVRAAPDRRSAVSRAWWAGAGFFLAAYHWLAPNVGPILVPFAALFGLLWVLWAPFVWWALRSRSPVRALTAVGFVPSMWVVGEFVRAWEALGGPWALWGASQWANQQVLGVAAFGGVWLLSWVLVAINVAVAIAIVGSGRRVRAAGAVAAVVLVAGMWLLAGLQRPDTSGHVVVAGVQPGVIHEVEPRFQASEQLTATLDPGGVDLVVWASPALASTPRPRPTTSNGCRWRPVMSAPTSS